MTTIYSIGHSRHSGERFTALLRAQQIARLVDVRSYPVSKWAPQFEKLALAGLLARHAIEYLFLGRELGGKRAELYGADGSLDYARRAQVPDFQAAIVRLAALARERTTVVLCAEEDPSRCHRRLLVAPALRHSGLKVVHVRGDGRLESDHDSPLTSGQLGLFC
jgi:uncharacterized protein (DUF488 family)